MTAHPEAQRWLADHPRVRGGVIATEDAAAAGRAVFGEVLSED